MKLSQFKKHEQFGGSYKIGYYYNNKFKKFVDANQPSYVKWLENNSPDIIRYAPPSREQLESKIKDKITTNYNELIYADFEFPQKSGIFYSGDRESFELLKESVMLFSLKGSVPKSFKLWDIENKSHSITLPELKKMFIQQCDLKIKHLIKAKVEKDKLGAMAVTQLLKL